MNNRNMTIGWNSKSLWLTISAAIIFLIIFRLCSNVHSGDWEKPKDYMWIFKDSVKKDIDTTFYFSWVKKRDIYNHYIYKSHYFITLCDFKDLYTLDLDDVIINSKISLDELDISDGKGEVLNSKSSPNIAIRFGRTFHNKMKINLDNNSQVLKWIEKENYKGFYGIVNKMTFSNGSNENCIQFSYPKGKEQTLLLLYKKNPEFYMIIIESQDSAHYKFDENFLNILNLEN